MLKSVWRKILYLISFHNKSFQNHFIFRSFVKNTISKNHDFQGNNQMMSKMLIADDANLIIVVLVFYDM